MNKNSGSSISNLVAEQPGLLITVAGIIISILVGLTLRALTREDKLKTKLDTFIAGTGVQYEKVYFSLARGWWPDFSVIITQVHYENQDACVLSPSIDAHEVRIPFSVISLLLGEVEVEKIEVDSAVALLRADARECKHELAATANNNPNSPAKITSSTSTAVTTTTSKASGPVPSAIESRSNSRMPPLIIRQLRVNYLPQAFASAEFTDLELKINQIKPLKFSVDSSLESNAEFAARSQLRIDYDETQAKTMVLKLDGIWREGRFTLDSYAEKKTNKYGLEFQAEQIPLSQTAPVLKKYGIINSEFSGKQAWISFTINSEGKWTHMTHSPWKISNLSLEGDLGEVHAEGMNFTSFEPLQVEPFDLKIEKLDLDQLLNFLGRPNPSKTLLSLGVLQGNLHVESPASVQFAGKLKGVEFIFANKGLREIMPIQSAEMDLSLSHEIWKGTLSNIRMAENGEFYGGLNFRAPVAGDSLHVSTQFEKLVLQRSIGNLLSNGGAFPRWKGALNLDFKKGQLISISGDLAGDEGVIESVEVTNPKLKFYSLPETLALEGKIAPIEFDLDVEQAKIPASTIVGQYIQRVLIVDHPTEGGTQINISSLRAKFTTDSLKNFSWKSFDFQTAQQSLHSYGGWDEKDQLSGELINTDLESKRQVIWTIKGTRDQPEITSKDSLKN